MLRRVLRLLSTFGFLVLFFLVDGILAWVGLFIFEEFAELVVPGGEKTSQDGADPVCTIQSVTL